MAHFSEKKTGSFSENYESSGRDFEASAWADLRGPRATVAPTSDRFSVPVAGMSRELEPRIDEFVQAPQNSTFAKFISSERRQNSALDAMARVVVLEMRTRQRLSPL